MRIVGVEKVPGVQLVIMKGGSHVGICWPNGTESDMKHFPLETAEDTAIYRERPIHVWRDQSVRERARR